MSKEVYELKYICTEHQLSEQELFDWIELEIIHPYNSERLLFDEEDIRRIAFICELKKDCSANNESLQVILHLLDQVYFLHKKLARYE